MLPNARRGERPYVPPAQPLNPATRAATAPVAPERHPWAPPGRPVSHRVPAAASSPAQPILLAGGANPAELVNAINPAQGFANTIGYAPTPAVVVDAGTTGGSGGGFTDFAFLAGAVFVAWLVLKGGH